MLREFQFGREGLAWVRQCLSAGNTLSKTLLDLPLEEGRVFTYASNGVDLDRLAKFQWGGIFNGIGADMDEKWAEFISDYLRGPGKRYCVFEDISLPTDPGLDSTDEQLFVYDSEVYDFLSPRDRDIDSIRFAMSRARQYPSVGTLASITAFAGFRHRQEVTAEILQLLSRSTDYILVGAYDEESYLVWGRE